MEHTAGTLNLSDLTETAYKIMLSESWVHNPDDLALLNAYYRARDNAVHQASYTEQTIRTVVTSPNTPHGIPQRQETSVPASVTHRKMRTFASPFPMRVYTSRTDRTGTVLCPVHRSEFFAIYPGGCSDGRRGQRCEMCPGDNDRT